MDKNRTNEIRSELKSIYSEYQEQIDKQLNQFENKFRNSNDEQIFHELCFCILSSGVGPKIAERSLNAIKNELWDGSAQEMAALLEGMHKYPDKASYLTSTRDYLKKEYDFKLKSLVKNFEDRIERRDFFANNKNIKGLGYVQASHFLRNLGFKGYAILDRNNINTLFELQLLETNKPPSSRKKYIETEKILEDFAEKMEINIDELDLVLWFYKRGYIPK